MLFHQSVLAILGHYERSFIVVKFDVITRLIVAIIAKLPRCAKANNRLVIRERLSEYVKNISPWEITKSIN